MLGDYVALKLMKANFATSLALILAMAACGSAPSGSDAEAGKQSSFKPMNGYRDLELGMSFEAAIGKLDSDLFNPASLKECFDDLALRGCGLMRKSTESMYEMRSGIPYALRLNFNSDDKLTDIELNYRRESRITGEQCRRIFGRTVDWAVADYGPLTFKRTGAKTGTYGENGNMLAKTPEGTDYLYGIPGKSGSFVVSFMHPLGEKVILKTEKGNQLVFSDQRTISVFASYIVVGNGICEVQFEIREPDSVERPAFLSE